MKTVARQARHDRVRARIHGTAARPRLVVFRGSRTLSAQLIDDASGQTITTKQAAPATVATGTALGQEIAKLAKQKKVTQVVFDRAGYQYHGVIKAVAEAVRESGITI